jgi:hypothetical protein
MTPQSSAVNVVGAIGQNGRILISGDSLAVVREFLDYLKVAQVESTKRMAIEVERDVFIQNIEAKKEVMLTYFEQRFTERREALDRLFNMLDTALARTDSEMADRSLSGILGIIQDSPLKDCETFAAAWQNPDTIIEL